MRFGHRLLLLETFVDPQRFRGTVYRAVPADVKLVVAWTVKFTQPFCRFDLPLFDNWLRYRAGPDSSEPLRRVASFA